LPACHRPRSGIGAAIPELNTERAEFGPTLSRRVTLAVPGRVDVRTHFRGWCHLKSQAEEFAMWSHTAWWCRQCQTIRIHVRAHTRWHWYGHRRQPNGGDDVRSAVGRSRWLGTRHGNSRHTDQDAGDQSSGHATTKLMRHRRSFPAQHLTPPPWQGMARRCGAQPSAVWPGNDRKSLTLACRSCLSLPGKSALIPAEASNSLAAVLDSLVRRTA
jgi:hypothetical protein